MNSLGYSIIFSVCLNIRIFDIYLDLGVDSATCSHVKTQTYSENFVACIRHHYETLRSDTVSR